MSNISIHRELKCKQNFLKAFLFVNNIFSYFTFFLMFNIQTRIMIKK